MPVKAHVPFSRTLVFAWILYARLKLLNHNKKRRACSFKCSMRAGFYDAFSTSKKSSRTVVCVCLCLCVITEIQLICGEALGALS